MELTALALLTLIDLFVAVRRRCGFFMKLGWLLTTMATEALILIINFEFEGIPFIMIVGIFIAAIILTAVMPLKPVDTPA